MIIKKFKNGNINARMEKEDFSSRMSVFEMLYYNIDDCSIFGEEHCLSNYDMAIDLYSYYYDKIICLPFSDMERLKTGATVKFYARKLDKWDRERKQELEEMGEM